jgi:hypothetical protein
VLTTTPPTIAPCKIGVRLLNYVCEKWVVNCNFSPERQQKYIVNPENHTTSHRIRLLRAYQPLLVALRALEVEQLDGDGLRLPYAGLDPLIDPALVHGPEPALANEVAH